MSVYCERYSTSQWFLGRFEICCSDCCTTKVQIWSIVAQAWVQTPGSKDLTPLPTARIMYKKTSASMVGSCIICLSVNTSRNPKKALVSFGNAYKGLEEVSILLVCKTWPSFLSTYHHIIQRSVKHHLEHRIQSIFQCLVLVKLKHIKRHIFARVTPRHDFKARRHTFVSKKEELGQSA